VTLPAPLARFWEAMSEVNELWKRTPWGYVVADRRYPRVWDANHAAVLSPRDDTTLQQIRDELLPVLRWAGASTEHEELWGLAPTAPLRGEAEARQRPLPTDVDMVFTGDLGVLPDRPVSGIDVLETTSPTDEFLRWYRTARRAFGTDLDDDVLDQMLARDVDVFLPRGMRLFVAWNRGDPVGYASLISLAGVGYLDGVMTSPEFRRRGIATATVTAAVLASLGDGDETVHLLAEERGTARRLYERLGFRVATTVVSLTRPLDVAD